QQTEVLDQFGPHWVARRKHVAQEAARLRPGYLAKKEDDRQPEEMPQQGLNYDAYNRLMEIFSASVDPKITSRLAEIDKFLFSLSGFQGFVERVPEARDFAPSDPALEPTKDLTGIVGPEQTESRATMILRFIYGDGELANLKIDRLSEAARVSLA